MKFNVQRVLTPAYLTSIALVVVGVLLGLAWYPVAAWLVVLAGLVLNAMAVSVTEIHDAPRAPGTSRLRRPALPSRGVRPGPRGAGSTGVRSGAPDEVAPVAPAGKPRRGEPVEPEAETAATPTVPHTGSSTLKAPRSA